MTARELAEELLKNPDDIVCCITDNFEQEHNYVLFTSPRRFKGKIEKKQFRDAFDGETYTSEIISPAEKGRWFVKL